MEQRFEEKILEILVGMQSDVSGMNKDIRGLQSNVSDLKDNVKLLQNDVSDLKGDVKELQNDVSDLKGDVKELQSDMKAVKLELSDLSLREDHHYNMLQQSIGDAFESVKILDQKKLDKAALKKII